ncbi:hypothetical protein HMPREF9120_00886 [Neisseria sp. oral taxon 020 str. F0370]|nr:hypothetical protein HMPREF9120_00886 [Neisseria sp. oral taxon 020 str. F0370]
MSVPIFRRPRAPPLKNYSGSKQMITAETGGLYPKGRLKTARPAAAGDIMAAV